MKKLLFIFALLLCLPLGARADIAPAEQINYNFVFEGVAPSKIVPHSCEQVQCDDTQCLQQKPLGSFGIQGLKCSEDDCYSVSYEFTPYQKLIIKFADGSVKESAPFKKSGKRKSSFTVTVTPQELLVAPATTPARNKIPVSYAIFSMIFVFGVEILAAAMFIVFNNLPLRLLPAFALLNFIIIPLNWFIFSNFTSIDGILWLGALLAEFVVLWLIFRRRYIANEILGMTLFANVAGYACGMLLSFMITFL